MLIDLYADFHNELRARQGLKPHKRGGYRKDVERCLSNDKIFLAEIDGDAVGFIRISEREGCYWIEEIYVKPEYLGKGIAKELVKSAENYVKDRNAMGFWTRMGYRILNTIELTKKLERGIKRGRYRC